MVRRLKLIHHGMELIRKLRGYASPIGPCFSCLGMVCDPRRFARRLRSRRSGRWTTMGHMSRWMRSDPHRHALPCRAQLFQLRLFARKLLAKLHANALLRSDGVQRFFVYGCHALNATDTDVVTHSQDVVDILGARHIPWRRVLERLYISNAASLARCRHTARGLRRAGWRRKAVHRSRRAKTWCPGQRRHIVGRQRVEWMALHSLCRRCRRRRHLSVVSVTPAGKVAA